MPQYAINRILFPELKGKDLSRFKDFMQSEFPAYINDKDELYAHNDGDSHWFTQQYLEAKSGKGIYQDFFKKQHN